MGLDISYYRKLSPAPEITDIEKQEAYDTHAEVLESIIAWVEKNWPGRSEGLLPGVYSYAERDGFRAGSYGGYSQWRSQLAQYAHGKTAEQVWQEDAAGPAFYELIHFADNEGVIGPVVSKKLAQDFEQNRARIFELAAGDDWFRCQYDKWAKAFSTAADGGMVEFH